MTLVLEPFNSFGDRCQPFKIPYELFGECLLECGYFAYGYVCFENLITEHHFVLRWASLQMRRMKSNINGTLRTHMIPSSDVGIPMKFFEINENTV
jgi:hypothetical protein